MGNLKDRTEAHPLVKAFFEEVKGFSIKDASAASGLDRYTIIHWRTGRVRSPKLVEFDYLLQSLGYELTFRKITTSPENEMEGRS